MKRQQGFTLVELIVVIVILGILAATALPKFINVTVEARTAAVNGIAGALRSSVGVAQGKYYAVGNTAATTVLLADGTSATVTAGSGLPVSTQGGIGSMVGCGTGSATSCQGMTTAYTATTATFFPSGGNATTCSAVYTAADGSVATTVTGC